MLKSSNDIKFEKVEDPNNAVLPIVTRRSDRLRLEITKHELDRDKEINEKVVDMKRKRVKSDTKNVQMAFNDASDSPKLLSSSEHTREAETCLKDIKPLSSSGFTQEVEESIIDRIRKSRENLNDEDGQSIDTFISLGIICIHIHT